jgi:cytochrome P450
MFSAGSDTSATTMAWGMAEMIRNPTVMKKAQAEVRNVFNRNGKADETAMNEVKYLKLVVKETLRLHPPASLLVPRESTERCEINGKADETAMNEMKYLKLVVMKTLRLHAPAPLLVPRESTERCEINGYEIPVKTKVIVNAWAIGRDPKYWNEPEKFDPERFLDNPIDYKGTNFEFIPFGAGKRIFPGMTFGLVNVEFALELFLYHFDWKLPSGMKH